MSSYSIDLPLDWQAKPIRKAYRFTRKPRGITVADSISIPFLPGSRPNRGSRRCQPTVYETGARLRLAADSGFTELAPYARSGEAASPGLGPILLRSTVTPGVTSRLYMSSGRWLEGFLESDRGRAKESTETWKSLKRRSM